MTSSSVSGLSVLTGPAPADSPAAGGPGGGVGEDARRWWDQTWLPRRPLATDDFLAGVYRMPRARAAGKRYVEANPQAISNLLVVDVDHSDAVLRVLWDRDGWRPNVVVENPGNGHAHAVWVLDEAITRTEHAHRAPIRYGARITEGLRRSVGGDKGYSGLLTKNPVHDTWDTRVIHRHLYCLAELEAYLAKHGYMPPERMLDQKRWRLDPTGLGRNEALFRAISHRYHRELRHHFGDPDGLATAILTDTIALNATFTDPLPATEVAGIARSITRWITTKSRMWADGPVVYAATFTTIQAARGRKGSGRNGGLTGSGRNGGLTGDSRPGGHIGGRAGSGRNGGLTGDSRPGGLIGGVASGDSRREQAVQLRAQAAEVLFS